MFMKAYFISKKDAETIKSQHSYVLELTVSLNGLNMPSVEKELEYALKYDHDCNGILADLGSCYLYCHLQFGVMTSLVANAVSEALKMNIAELELPCTAGGFMYLRAHVSRDGEKLLVEDGNDIWLNLSNRFIFNLTLSDFVKLLTEGHLPIDGRLIMHTSKNTIPLTHNAADLPFEIFADSNDISFPLELDSYLKLFTHDQFAIDHDSVEGFIRHLCYHVDADDNLEVLESCPMSASALLRICCESSSLAFRHLGHGLRITTSIEKCNEADHYLQFNNYLSITIFSHQYRWDEFSDKVLCLNTPWQLWEKQFVHWFEFDKHGYGSQFEGPVYRLLQMHLKKPEADVHILKTMINLLFTYNGKPVFTKDNQFRVMSGLALYLKKCYPVGKLYSASNKFLVYADVNDLFYNIVFDLDDYVLEEYTMMKCNLERAIQYLYTSVRVSSPCGLLQCLDTEMDLDDWRDDDEPLLDF